MFAADVPKKPYMKTDLVIKRLKALETGTWFRQSNIPTGAQYNYIQNQSQGIKTNTPKHIPQWAEARQAAKCFPSRQQTHHPIFL